MKHSTAMRRVLRRLFFMSARKRGGKLAWVFHWPILILLHPISLVTLFFLLPGGWASYLPVFAFFAMLWCVAWQERGGHEGYDGDMGDP